MTATQNTSQVLAVLDPNRTNEWMEVHANGCSHLRRGKKGEGSWTMEARSLEEAATEIGSDFLNEGSMTLEDCLEQIRFAPCVKLPRALGLPTPSPRKMARKAGPTPAEVNEGVAALAQELEARGAEVIELRPVKAPRKALPNSERRSEATHPAGGSAVSHGKCPTCGARKGHVCVSSKTGQPTNFVHAPRMAAWEAKGSPSLPLPRPARKTAEGWVVK